MGATEIGKAIADLRKEKGITQEVLAGSVGVSTQAVSKWETGVAAPDVALLPVIADYFGTSIDALFGRKRGKPDEASALAKEIARASSKGETIDFFLDRCWDLHLDYFDPTGEQTEAQRSRAKQEHSSRITLDAGFANIRTGLGFVLMPDPPGGWKSVLDESEAISELLAAVAAPGFLRTLAFLMQKDQYSFTVPALARACTLDEKQCNQTIDTLTRYGLVNEKQVSVDDEQITVYDFDATRLPMLLVVLAYAREFMRSKCTGYYGYIWSRSVPFY